VDFELAVQAAAPSVSAGTAARANRCERIDLSFR
jgi:hypothetical protein